MEYLSMINQQRNIHERKRQARLRISTLQAG